MGGLLTRQEYTAVKDPPVKKDVAKASAASLPPELCLTEPDNIALPVSYLLCGFLPALIANPTTVFMVDQLDATSAQQNTVAVAYSLPWCFKVGFGFLTDAFPLSRTSRRKPYFVLGFAIHMVANACLARFARPSVTQLATCSFFATFGRIMSDVMADAMMVERTKLEPRDMRGTFQSKCYLARFYGALLGAVLGGCLYSKQVMPALGLSGSEGGRLPYGAIVWITVYAPLALLLPTVPLLLDDALGPAGRGRRHDHAGEGMSAARRQCAVLWDVAQRRAVWQPMAFVFLFNVLQWRNAAWSSFLRIGLDFRAYELGALHMVAHLMTLLGAIAYRRYFMKTSLRALYFWSTLVVAVLGTGQLLLILGWNRQLGIPDFVFALGDDALTQCVSALLYIPVCIMFSSLCPDGSEGFVYALLTSFSNTGETVARALSNGASHLWDVTNDAIRAHDYRGVFNLELLTTFTQLVPILFVYLLMPSQQQQRQLERSGEKSALAGKLFIGVFVASIVFAIINGVIELADNSSGSGTIGGVAKYAAGEPVSNGGPLAPPPAPHSGMGGGPDI